MIFLAGGKCYEGAKVNNKLLYLKYREVYLISQALPCSVWYGPVLALDAKSAVNDVIHYLKYG